MLHDIMQLAAGITQVIAGIGAIVAIISGAYYGWKERHQEATYYLVAFLVFKEILK